MSVSAMTWAFAQPLSGNEKVVLLALADCENGHTRVCIPGQERLAKMASVSVRTVSRVLAKLEAEGYIERDRRMSTSHAGGRKSDSYRLLMDSPDKLSGEPDLSGKPPEVTGQNEQGYRTTVSVTENQKKEPEEVFTQEFEIFWQAYPRHVAKSVARKSWASAIKKAKPEVITAAAARYAKSVSGSEERFIAHPSTWLNQERWDDFAGKPATKPVDWMNAPREKAGWEKLRDGER